jgi:hypothetical protein
MYGVGDMYKNYGIPFFKFGGVPASMNQWTACILWSLMEYRLISCT